MQLPKNWNCLWARSMAKGGVVGKSVHFHQCLKKRDEQSKICTLCHGQHSQILEQKSCKNELAQTITKSLQMALDCLILYQCGNDMTKLVRNSDHLPRWAKPPQSICCLPGCIFTQSKMATQALLALIAHAIGYSSSPALPIPTPLSKHHYHLIYNILQSTQTYCLTCGTWLKSILARFALTHIVFRHPFKKIRSLRVTQYGAKVCSGNK